MIVLPIKDAQVSFRSNLPAAEVTARDGRVFALPNGGAAPAYGAEIAQRIVAAAKKRGWIDMDLWSEIQDEPELTLEAQREAGERIFYGQW